MLKVIHAKESAASARIKTTDVAVQLRQAHLGKAVDLVEKAIEGTPTFHGFPDNHWVRIGTNNPIERFVREIRRRTRAVGALPDGQSALMQCSARLRHFAGTELKTRSDLNVESLFK